MNAIRKVRLKNSISQDDLAEAAGVSQPTISRWESDDLFPSTAEIQRICARYPVFKPAHFFPASFIKATAAAVQKGAR